MDESGICRTSDLSDQVSNHFVYQQHRKNGGLLNLSSVRIFREPTIHFGQTVNESRVTPRTKVTGCGKSMVRNAHSPVVPIFGLEYR